MVGEVWRDLSALYYQGPALATDIWRQYSLHICITLTMVIALFVWRLWLFSIRSYLHPEQLEYLPYWIPGVGHAFAFYCDAQALFTRANKLFCGKPFMLHVAGEDLAVFMAASQISQVFNDANRYSFDPVIDLIYDGVGKVSREGRSILWREPTDGFVSLHPNPQGHVLVHVGVDLLRKQLLQPGAVQDLLIKVVTEISKTMLWDSFYDTTVLASNGDERVVSLHCWCRDVMIEAQNRALFGPRLPTLERGEMRLAFEEWDYNSWRILYQVPGFMAKRAKQPRDRLIQLITQYLSLNYAHRAEGLEFIQELQNECAHAGLHDQDIAGIITIITWGINSNVRMTSFWMVAYLMNNQAVIMEIRREIATAMEAIDISEHTNGAALVDIIKHSVVSGCPLLNSTFNETIRLCSTYSSIRLCTRDSNIDGYELPKGTKILLPVRTQMLNSEVFGNDAHLFNCYRFMQNKSLERSECFRPFGGGATLCSGRMIGRIEVLSFVAFLVWRYDLEVVGHDDEMLGVKGMHFPRLDGAKPASGVSKQVEGDDMILRIKKRAG